MSAFPGGNVETLLIAADPDSFYTYPIQDAVFDLDRQTIVGNVRHGGQTTLADVRTPAYRKKQDVTLNRQAVSVVGAEDLDYLANKLSLDEDVALSGLLHRYHVDNQREDFAVPTDHYRSFLESIKGSPGALNRLFLAQCLGANIVVGGFQATDGTPNFRSLQRGLDVGPNDDSVRKFTSDGATVMITRPNAPCIGPGKLIEATYDTSSDGIERAKEFVRTGQGRRGFVGMITKGGQMAIGQTVSFVPFGE
jgi:hypothetical protein